MSMTPFRKLLIANRGEIAVRIMRTARLMGLSTVAIYSDVDADALHVAMADEAVPIGRAPPAESYLNVDAIIAAARACGADAVHPGYGFLAENAAFAKACTEAGLVFVGPSAASIRAMGDKASAKAIMTSAGVPCVPGWQGEGNDPDMLAREADRIGFPLMIKATAGGGGRGMRLVEDAARFAAHLRAARSEAKAAFGDDRVLLERAIVDPRHIEIQVVADRHGNAIHLGERDCSVQRRHQKLIEEAPSPAVTQALRQRMGEAAVAAVKAIGYEGAGTLEFLLDASGNFFFMEMNTRLQVEHPVTEAITGLDIVRLQLEVAAGLPLTIRQEDVHFDGHAIEVRLCAEDPEAGFLPQSGTIGIWDPPDSLRIDHGLRSGSDVPPHYDSMIAKLVAHGRTRDEARVALVDAVERTVALGVRTNQRFLAACLRHPVFAAGDVTTGFIGRHVEELIPAEDPGEAAAAARVAAFLRAAPSAAVTHGFAAPVRLARNGTTYDLSTTSYAGGRVEVAGRENQIFDVLESREGKLRYWETGRERFARLWRGGDRVWVHAGGRTWDFEDRTFASATTGAVAGDGKVRASMNGRVVSVDVALGDVVEAGQTVLVLEAMKMEHVHVSRIAGRVSGVHVAAGDQAETGRVVVEVETVAEMSSPSAGET